MIATGSVILIRFPFSDLSADKRRPAVVLADAGRGDWVLCQVTSNAQADPAAARLEAADFTRGGLDRVSYARPLKLFTAHRRIFVHELGRLRPPALARVVDAVVAGLRPTTRP